jgi:UDP-glucose 4-epimerase
VKILVTGGAGFIGSAIVRRLLSVGYEVVVFDNFETGRRANVPADVAVVEGDIRDPEALRRACRGVDDVVHQAAMVSVPISVAEPSRCWDINVSGTRNVLEAALGAGCRRVTMASSAAVYGSAPPLPTSEDAALAPASPYAYSKYLNEIDARYFGRYTALETLCFRYFNVYGPGQSPTSPYSGVISILARQLLLGAPITIFGSGIQTRDFVFVGDVAAVVMGSLALPRLDVEVLNVGQGRQVTLLELIAKLAQVLGRAPEIHFAEKRAGDVMHSVASIKALTGALAYRPNTLLVDGLRMTTNWMQDDEILTNV